MWESARVDSDGMRHVHLSAASGHARERQAVATAITSRGKAIVLVTATETPSILVATSEDSGIHAGDRVKELVAAHGGRGGGSPRVGQGSIPAADAIGAIVSSFGAA